MPTNYKLSFTGEELENKLTAAATTADITKAIAPFATKEEISSLATKEDLNSIDDSTFGGYTVSQFIDIIYPIGSVYLSLIEINPTNLFGGTWEQIKDTFLLAAGDSYAAGDTGGETEHTLTVDEMPSHNHYLKGASMAVSDYFGGSTNDYGITHNGTAQQTNDLTHTGGDQPHNNMPPYLAIYMWKRIS